MDYFTHICVGFVENELSRAIKNAVKFYELEEGDAPPPRSRRLIEALRQTEEISPNVEIVEKDEYIYFEGDSVNVEVFSELIKIAMKEVGENGMITFSYALTASRSHIEAFGGGAVKITAKKITDISTSEIVQKWKRAARKL